MAPSTEIAMLENDTNRDRTGSPGQDDTNRVYANTEASVELRTPPAWVWFSVAGLFLVALSVIFVLPALVTRYELPFEARVDLPQLERDQLGAQSAPNISPFEEAQRSLKRREAQEVLAELLVRQETLGDLGVGSWSLSDFDAALEIASVGDNHYRSGDFTQAKDSYSKGLKELDLILESVPTKAQAIFEEAQEALDQSNSVVAQERFTLAVLLDPNNEKAQIGLERSLVLEEVLTLLDEASDLLGDNEFDISKEIYENILLLDPYNEIAKQKIIETSAAITERAFFSAMTAGYKFVEANDPEQAIARFRSALQLGIRMEEASAAIMQVETQVADAQIELIREDIDIAEKDEDWLVALNGYENVLAIDPNVLFAIDGRDYASKRAQLDDLLRSSIAGPERFYEEDVYQQTLDIYYTGLAVQEENPGVHLADQLGMLEVLLADSQIPLEINFISDNLTEVNLLRIGGLGLFEQTTVSLKPGRYVALGKRIGYRDVRKEFVVGFGQTPEEVLVRCAERVAPTNR